MTTRIQAHEHAAVARPRKSGQMLRSVGGPRSVSGEPIAEIRMVGVRGTWARSRTSVSGLLISNRVNSRVYPCASERRLQRPGEERATPHRVARIGFFCAHPFRAIEAPHDFGKSLLHPAMHPNAETPNTNINSPAVIVLLRTFFRRFGSKSVTFLSSACALHLPAFHRCGAQHKMPELFTPEAQIANPLPVCFALRSCNRDAAPKHAPSLDFASCASQR